MRILFLTTHLNTGGITSYLYTLAQALTDLGHQIFVVSSGGDREEEFRNLGVHVKNINIKTKSELSWKIYFALVPLTGFIKENKIDIIHAHTRVAQVLGSFLQRLSAVPMVATCHGFFRPKLFRKIFPCWGMRSIAISRPVYNHLRDDLHVAADQIALIENGIDLHKFIVPSLEERKKKRAEFGIGDEPLIGIIARLSDVKGQDILIWAMSLVIKKHPQAKLFILGEGKTKPALEKLVGELKLEKSIQFYALTNQIAENLIMFDVFAMPSRQEGLGLSVLEAMACGVPVVASSVGGLKTIIQDSVTGLLVEPENVEALADAIDRILENKALSEQMAQRARSFVEKNFDADVMVEKTLNLYKSLFGYKK